VTQPWPVQITSLTAAACGAARWRTAGASWVTVIVKATFDLVHGQLATLTTPREIVREDRYRERTGSLEDASEMAPYLPSAGVLLAGHACAPGGRAAPTAAARLAIVRERPLLDKTVHVFGDRAPGATHAQPFVKMPLVYERAYGGAGTPENPAGVGSAGTGAQPNVLDTRSPQRPAGFGPISRYWPARKRLLGGGDERGLLASDPAIPERFDWRYFHAAPPDQQIELLRGDEWIVLDGLHPTLPRVQSRLPSAVGRARWHVATPSGIGPAQAIELAADTLVIDADRLICSVVWRGRFPLTRPDLAPWVRVFAGVELFGQSITWGRPGDAAAAEPGTTATAIAPMQLGPNGPLPVAPRPAALAGTSDLDLRAVLATILPFAAPDPWRPPAAAVRAEAPQPVMARAPASVAETSELDLRHILSAIVPFNAAKPKPSPLATTGGMDDSAIRAAMPFLASDPSRPVLAAIPQPAVARVRSSLGGTADDDMQQAMRAILPFMGTPQAGPSAVQPAPSPMALVERPMMMPEPPAPSPVHAAQPTQPQPVPAIPPTVESVPEPRSIASPPEPASAPAPVPSAPTAPGASPAPPLAPVPIKAAPVAEPANLREQIFARLHARASLQGLPLGGADLQDFDFSGASLAGLDFTRANLRRANLSGAQAAEIQLEGADLTEAILERADLARANLTRADVTQARFDGATLTGANLQRLSGDAASFRTAKLQGADLRQASLPGARFDEAVMTKASSAKADYSGARFAGADLSGANLRDCKLREADFTRANLDGTDLRDADVSRAKLDGEARKTARLTPHQVKSLGDGKV
jgi:uncharacterized protein YjbI with pentapeptide repeats